MNGAEDKLFELMMRKQDEIHEDVRSIKDRLDAQSSEVYFIKKAFQVTWGGLAMLLAYLGVRNH